MNNGPYSMKVIGRLTSLVAKARFGIWMALVTLDKCLIS